MKHKIIGLDGLFKHSFAQFGRNLHHYLILSLLVWMPVILLVAATYFSLRPKWDVMVENEGSFSTVEFMEEEGATRGQRLMMKFFEMLVAEEDDTSFNVVQEVADETGGESLTDEESEARASQFVSKIFWIGFAAVVAMLIFIIYQTYYHLALARLAATIDHGSKILYKAIIQWSLMKLWSFIMLAIRIFIYTYMWLLLLGLLLSVASPILIASIGLEGDYLAFFPIFFGFVALGAIVMIIIRAPKTVVASYAFVDKEITSKEALGTSIKLTEGKWWRVIGYILALFVLAVILDTFVTKIFGNDGSFVLNIFMTYFAVTYFFGFYRLLQGERA